MKWMSLLITWLPFLTVMTLFVWWAQHRQRKLLDANRESIDAMKANTEALNALRRQLELHPKP
ncbi:hypothetical protein ACSBOB_22420 [Mesorhizobium sp. ASY16-5R]|jgi:preprotein translocase subunit YajC|uniref:hypothetical protein n=1 Tax=Mesorhizobium sp. ASY16-5R TaxID=3445772 RepID=UPI003F9F3599